MIQLLLDSRMNQGNEAEYDRVVSIELSRAEEECLSSIAMHSLCKAFASAGKKSSRFFKTMKQQEECPWLVRHLLSYAMKLGSEGALVEDIARMISAFPRDLFSDLEEPKVFSFLLALPLS
jgi:hypothetical protein